MRPGGPTTEAAAEGRASAELAPEELTAFVISNEPWGPQRFIKHRFATELAGRGAEVFFCDPSTAWSPASLLPRGPQLTEVEPGLNLVRYSHPLPARVGQRLAGSLNDRIMGPRLRRVADPRRLPVLWQFDAFRFAENHLGPPSLKIYHVCDPYMGLALDERSAEAADLIVCTSRQFTGHYAASHPGKTIHVPHSGATGAVRVDERAASEMRTRLGDYLFLGGSITDRVDVTLLARVSEAFPQMRLVIAGPVTGPERTQAAFAALTERENVDYRGTVPASEIPEYVAGARVCLSAYEFTERTPIGPRTSILKVMDYLGQGRPVVSSSPLEYTELEGRAIYCCGDADEFVTAIDRILEGSATLDVEAVDEFLASRTYSKALDRILAALAAVRAGEPVGDPA